jgi:hypothetical protein
MKFSKRAVMLPIPALHTQLPGLLVEQDEGAVGTQLEQNSEVPTFEVVESAENGTAGC